jgi:hypothetical protein
MITCPRRHLMIRCYQRGYTLDEVRACIVSEDEAAITVDETHPAYPAKPKPGFVPPQFVPQPPVPTSGPGTELSKLLKRFGIEPTPTCKCRAKAAQMNAWGCDECSKPERIEEVVAVMREEAKARGLPFVDMAGRVLVRRAISNARKEAARATQASNAEGQDAQTGRA